MIFKGKGGMSQGLRRISLVLGQERAFRNLQSINPSLNCISPSLCIPRRIVKPTGLTALPWTPPLESWQFYVTVYECPVLGRGGKLLKDASTTDNDGCTRRCTTFILLVPPQTILHVCRLDPPRNLSLSSIDIDSDVSDWNQHPAPDDEHPMVLLFPLDGEGPYLCTQGEGGSLTHFFLVRPSYALNPHGIACPLWFDALCSFHRLSDPLLRLLFGIFHRNVFLCSILPCPPPSPALPLHLLVTTPHTHTRRGLSRACRRATCMRWTSDARSGHRCLQPVTE